MTTITIPPRRLGRLEFAEALPRRVREEKKGTLTHPWTHGQPA